MRATSSTIFRVPIYLSAILALLSTASSGSVDDAHSFALQAAEPYVKEGYQVREDYWGGDLGSGEKKAVRQQLFKGNDYWFWMGSEVEQAKICAHVIPKRTSSYFVIIEIEQSPEERTHWALVYGFR